MQSSFMMYSDIHKDTSAQALRKKKAKIQEHKRENFAGGREAARIVPTAARARYYHGDACHKGARDVLLRLDLLRTFPCAK